MSTVTLDSYLFDVLMADLVGHDRRPSAYLVYLYLAAKAGGPKRRVAMSYHDLAVRTGLSKSAAQTAVRVLRQRKLIESRQETPTSTPEYEILRPWVRGR